MAEHTRDQTHHGIVVGVTGPGENTAALRWAADAAARTGAPVTLVHAVHQPLMPPPPSILIKEEPLREVARRQLDAAATEYTEISRGRHCRTLLVDGRPSTVLNELSAAADVVVLAHRDLSRVRRIVTWSNAAAVAGHAHCPVLAVPSGWTSADDERPWVTVGVHEGGSPEPVLEAAFTAAEASGASVRLVHAWRLDPVYDEKVVAHVDPHWRERIAEDVRTATEPIAKEHPDVAWEVHVEHEFPADELCRLAQTSALLVVGRHGHHVPGVPDRLGSIARVAFRRAACPVMVVPV